MSRCVCERVCCLSKPIYRRMEMFLFVPSALCTRRFPAYSHFLPNASTSTSTYSDVFLVATRDCFLSPVCCSKEHIVRTATYCMCCWCDDGGRRKESCLANSFHCRMLFFQFVFSCILVIPLCPVHLSSFMPSHVFLLQKYSLKILLLIFEHYSSFCFLFEDVSVTGFYLRPQVKAYSVGSKR
jgi:hypothetical protein